MADSVNNVTSSDYTKYTGTRNVGGMGKDDFLRLLTTQLEHQDPLNPASEQEMVGTLAQFTALEQTSKLADSMTALARANEWSQGGALLGRKVEGRDEAGDIIQGKVTGVRKVGENILLHLDTGKEIPMANLSGVIP